MKRLLNNQSKVILFLYILFSSKLAFADVETVKHKHAVSVQIGENGITGDSKSFGLQFFHQIFHIRINFLIIIKLPYQLHHFMITLVLNQVIVKIQILHTDLGKELILDMNFKTP